MDPTLTFDRLALVLRRPVVWDRDYEEHVRGLGALLRLLLTAGGHAAINCVDNVRADWANARQCQWCDGTDRAAAGLDTMLQHMTTLARAADQGKTDHFSRFFERRCWVFFDLEGLLAALEKVVDTKNWPRGELAPNLKRMENFLARIFSDTIPLEDVLQALRQQSEQHRSNGRQLYFSFSIDFSICENFVFTPQLVIWNYWPQDTLYAPPKEGTAAAPPALSAEQAADALQLFWNVIETAFAMLCEGFPLRNVGSQTGLKEEDRGLLFYFASPKQDLLPPAPEHYLTQQWLPALRTLVDRQLGSPDPLSKEVAAALVQGQLLTLCTRRPRDLRPHLILPCCPRAEQAWSAIERHLLTTADKLTYDEILIAQDTRRLMQELALWKDKHARWQWFINSVLGLASNLARNLAAAPATSRLQLYQAVSQIQQRLLQVGNDLLRYTQQVLALPEQLRQLMEASGHRLAGYLAVRDVARMESLGSTLAASHFAYAELKRSVDEAERQAQIVKQTYEGELATLTALLEQEKREAGEYLEKANFTVALGVGMLTLVTTLALMFDVRLGASDLPEFWIWQWGTRGLIVVAGLAFAVMLFRIRPRARSGRGWLNIPELTRKVVQLWELVRQPTDRDQDDAEAGRSILEFGDDLEKFSADWDREEKRRQQERRKEASQGRPGRSVLRKRARNLTEQSVLFIFLSWVWVERPFPIELPRTLALLRWKYPLLDRPRAETQPDDQEFFYTWQNAGYDRRQAERIKQWCEENCDKMSAKEFFDSLAPDRVQKMLARTSSPVG